MELLLLLLGLPLLSGIGSSSGDDDDDATTQTAANETLSRQDDGSLGNDTMLGSNGPDRLWGLNGNDLVNGLGQNDTVGGGPGRGKKPRAPS